MQINGTTPTNFQSPNKLQTPKNNPAFGVEFTNRVFNIVNGPLLRVSHETLTQIKTMHDHDATKMFVCDFKKRFIRGWRIFIENSTRPSQNAVIKGVKSLPEGLAKLIPHLDTFRLQHDLANELEASQRVLSKSIEQ